MSDNSNGPFNGEAILLDQSGEKVCLVLQPDSNISLRYDLYHKDSVASAWSLINSNNSTAIALDITANDLKGDKLGWKVACAALNIGTWPLLVQVFQSKQGTYQPISRVARYDMAFTNQEVLKSFFDEIRFN